MVQIKDKSLENLKNQSFMLDPLWTGGSRLHTMRVPQAFCDQQQTLRPIGVDSYFSQALIESVNISVHCTYIPAVCDILQMTKEVIRFLKT